MGFFKRHWKKAGTLKGGEHVLSLVMTPEVRERLENLSEAIDGGDVLTTIKRALAEYEANHGGPFLPEKKSLGEQGNKPKPLELIRGGLSRR